MCARLTLSSPGRGSAVPDGAWVTEPQGVRPRREACDALRSACWYDLSTHSSYSF
jgi:hypothetical protein